MCVLVLHNIVDASNHMKFVPLRNQKCKNQLIFINLHLNEYSQEFHYYPFKLNHNTLNDLSDKVCIHNKAGDINVSVFKVIKGINESKTLLKHISCEYKCKFDGIKCN